MESLKQEIENFLRKREEQNLLRTLHPMGHRSRGIVRTNNKEYIDLSSNDYLGLSQHPFLKEAAALAVIKYGLGSGASRLLSGDFEIHHQLEKEVAEFKNTESALVFNSGYQANVGILSALYGKNDAIFSDRLIHASIVDGILLSGARLFRFHHNDLNHLEHLLKKVRSRFEKALIVTETVFSMDGDRPPLKDMVELKEKYCCELYVDEAHATGVFGEHGSGVVEEEGLSNRVDFIMGTFGKALGGFGAYVACSERAMRYLINTARSFIYSTSLPPAIIAVNRASLQLIKKEPDRRKKLLTAADSFRTILQNKGLTVRGSSQIVPFIVGDTEKTVKLARMLQERGFWVVPIRPPTVPPGEARLRFSLTYDHNEKTLGALADAVSEYRI